MSATHAKFAISLSLVGCLPATPAAALLPAVYSFSTGDPDGKMATASSPGQRGSSRSRRPTISFSRQRPRSPARPSPASSPGTRSVSNVPVEIYRVFPTIRTRAAPAGRQRSRLPRRRPARIRHRMSHLAADAATGGLQVRDNRHGILHRAQLGAAGWHQSQTGQFTGGNGPVTGEENDFSMSFTNDLLLPANHYFFVPQVGHGSDGNFLWLSAPRPIAGGLGHSRWVYRPAELDP